MLSPLFHDLQIVNKSMCLANGNDDLHYPLKIHPLIVVSYQFSSSIYQRAHATSDLTNEWKPSDRFIQVASPCILSGGNHLALVRAFASSSHQNIDPTAVP
jgi:hypothetical protein